MAKKNNFHILDNCLDEITFEEIITTAYSNLKKPIKDNELRLEFHNLLRRKIENALEMFRTHFADIKKELENV